MWGRRKQPSEPPAPEPKAEAKSARTAALPGPTVPSGVGPKPGAKPGVSASGSLPSSAGVPKSSASSGSMTLTPTRSPLPPAPAAKAGTVPPTTAVGSTAGVAKTATTSVSGANKLSERIPTTVPPAKPAAEEMSDSKTGPTRPIGEYTATVIGDGMDVRGDLSTASNLMVYG